MTRWTGHGRLVLAAIITVVSLRLFAGEPAAALAPIPDPAIQTRIGQTVSAIVRGDEDLPERFEALRDPALGDRGTVLLQLALYLEKSTGTEQSMSAALILHQLAFTPDEKLEAILPHLDAAAPPLRRVLTELLSTIDRPEGGEPDFSFYETRLRKEKDSPPWALIRYLCEVSPDAALDSMERVYGAGPARLDGAAKNLDDLRKLLTLRDTGAAPSTEDRARARSALDTLSRDPGWWRRLYAANFLAAHPDLATPAMTERLKSDPNPLVGAALSR